MLDYGIFGQPYLDLEPHLGIEDYDAIGHEIVFGLSKLRKLDMAFLNQPESVEGLDAAGSALYRSFFSESFAHLGFSIYLRGPKANLAEGYGDGPTRWRARGDLTEESEHVSLFPRTMEMIRALPFKDLGRAIIYYNTPGVTSPVHIDYIDDMRKFEQFIYFNPLGTKKAYVLDRNRGKHYIESRAAIFNPQDRHGADASRRSNFTLRVDGVFTDAFLESTGLSAYRDLT